MSPFVLALLGVVGLWHSSAGAVLLTRRPVVGSRLLVCTVWLMKALASLALLNVAAQLAFPGTWEWRGGNASPLDVVYLTILTFASSGYGDVLPATALGKGLSMLTSFTGLAYATMLCTALWQHVAPRDGR